jgi:hypothetical protein
MSRQRRLVWNWEVGWSDGPPRCTRREVPTLSFVRSSYCRPGWYERRIRNRFSLASCLMHGTLLALWRPALFEGKSWRTNKPKKTAEFSSTREYCYKKWKGGRTRTFCSLLVSVAVCFCGDVFCCLRACHTVTVLGFFFFLILRVVHV